MDHLASSIIIHPIEPEKLKGIDPSTVKFFRFDAKAGAWHPVWNSGLNQELGYAWAKVREPGTYCTFWITARWSTQGIVACRRFYKRLYEGSNSPNEAKDLTEEAFEMLGQVPPANSTSYAAGWQLSKSKLGASTRKRT